MCVCVDVSDYSSKVSLLNHAVDINHVELIFLNDVHEIGKRESDERRAIRIFVRETK